MVDPMLAPDSISGDLTDLLTGKLPPRRDQSEDILFVFRGLALGDLAQASLAYEAATASDLGSRLWHQTQRFDASATLRNLGPDHDAFQDFALARAGPGHCDGDREARPQFREHR